MLKKGGRGPFQVKKTAIENILEENTANIFKKLCKWFKDFKTTVHFSKTSRYHLSLVFINYFRARIMS